MSDVVVMSVIAAIPPTVAALAALRASLRNGRVGNQIHEMVNGNLAAVKAERDEAMRLLIAARIEIEKLKLTASRRRARTRPK